MKAETSSGPLMTAKLRKAAAESAAARAAPIPIRVAFPDGMLLQGRFAAGETVADLSVGPLRHHMPLHTPNVLLFALKVKQRTRMVCSRECWLHENSLHNVSCDHGVTTAPWHTAG